MNIIIPKNAANEKKLSPFNQAITTPGTQQISIVTGAVKSMRKERAAATGKAGQRRTLVPSSRPACRPANALQKQPALGDDVG